jgi:GNAT superfamily N-acetyltransferase
MSRLVIREASAGDEGVILDLLRELAEYERLESRFRLTGEIIARDFLCAPPRLFCEIALLDEAPAGLMTWYPTYSSFAAARGIYLEDFYVRPFLRRRGIGRQLLAKLARRAIDENAIRIEWAVLVWNRPSIEFYETLRAERIDDWHIYRLCGSALVDLAKSAQT